MLAQVAPRCPNLRAVTIEVEDASTDTALAQASTVKKLVEKARAGGVATGRLRPAKAARAK